MQTLLRVALAGLLACSAAFAHDEEVDFFITQAHVRMRPAAQHAVNEDDTAFFDTLIKHGYLVNKPINSHDGRTALHEAVMHNKPVMIRHLLKLGADPLARDKAGDRPVDGLAYDSGLEFNATLEALKREPAEYDRRKLMDVPAPVWREVLGRPDPHDPLAPPAPDMPDPALVPFVSINDQDPPAEMKRVLDAHYPGWRAASIIEYAEGGPSQYRDKNTKEFGRKVEITLVTSNSDKIQATAGNRFAEHAHGSGFPTYEYKIRTVMGDAHGGGGTRGHVVLIVGYWIKIFAQNWDE